MYPDIPSLRPEEIISPESKTILIPQARQRLCLNEVTPCAENSSWLN
jgi:hypothetical protein